MKSADPVSLVLCGSGGMGAVYLQELFEKTDGDLFRIEGVVEPFPERSPHLGRLQAQKIPIYADLGAFYGRHSAELAIVSSPIQYHCEQTCLALENGSHVLCEKPVAATIQEGRRMVEARVKAGRWVAIGYQWSFSAAVQDLKADILSGRFGMPRRMKCLYLWPRDLAYYGRNDWAGKKRDRSGAWILDSPANNAMAHDLHNIFYVLGRDRDSGAVPVEVEAELYRAYDLENFDTAAARCRTDGDVEILFFVSHVSAADKGPVFHYDFEKGTVAGEGRNADIRARFADGTAKNYGCPDREPMKKLHDCLESARTGVPPVCGLEAALSQTLCLDGMQDSMPDIAAFPEYLLRRETAPDRKRIWIAGLDEIFERGYETLKLPSELDVPWSRPGAKIDLTRYESFPSARA